MGYVGKLARDSDLDFDIPIAVRQVEFSEDEFVTSDLKSFRDCGPFSEEGIEQLQEETTTILRSGENSVILVTDEYPIVSYSKDFEKSENQLMGLNAFIDEVHLSIVDGYETFYSGKTFKPEEGFIDGEALSYVIDCYNCYKTIIDAGLDKFLRKKPNLTVSKEGILVFYTKTEIQATIDCASANIVGVEEIAEVLSIKKRRNLIIESIDSDNELILSYESNNQRKVLKKCKIKFLVDMLQRNRVPILKLVSK